jgi:hypothetical protein
MFTNVINEYIEYIKKIYLHIYNNYSYKQVFLFLLVFITIYIVEKLSRFNALLQSTLPVIPGLPSTQQTQVTKTKDSTTLKMKQKTKKSKK